jgi:hypothetical protein
MKVTIGSADPYNFPKFEAISLINLDVRRYRYLVA